MRRHLRALRLDAGRKATRQATRRSTAVYRVGCDFPSIGVYLQLAFTENA